MSKKSSKFIQLEWECPGCDARNPGPEKSCLSCGAPQPDDVEFVAPAERKFVADEKSLKRAKAGADIYCAFCETRNPAIATKCIQCGADLAEGERRKAGGKVRQRAAEKMILCPNCEAENLSSNGTCGECGAPLVRAEKKLTTADQALNKRAPKRNWLIGLVLVFIICCVASLVLFLSPSSSVDGRVSQVHWQTSISIEEEQEAHYSNKRGNPPSDAYDVSCDTKSEKVCTEQTVDQGNGYAEVIEECETRREEYCSYTVLEWQIIETLTLDGNDYDPHYASPSLSNEQRLGSESAEYEVIFSADGEMLNYTPNDLDEYRQFQIGSTWTINMNRLGGIVSVER